MISSASSGHFMCYLNRTIHMLTTTNRFSLVFPLPLGYNRAAGETNSHVTLVSQTYSLAAWGGCHVALFRRCPVLCIITHTFNLAWPSCLRKHRRHRHGLVQCRHSECQGDHS